MFLLKFILFIFIFGVIAVGFTLARVWWTVRNMGKQIRRNAEEMGAGASGRTTSGRTTSTGQGDTITDTRDPKRANRKIFADDEGEYVDFEEER